MRFPRERKRLQQRKRIKGVIFGRSGIGKTSLLWTLNASTTLFLDLEAGDLAVEGLEIDTLRPRTWKECRDFAVFIGGPNPALRDEQPYSQAHFDEVCGRYGDPTVIGKYETVFIDSITVAGRLCFQWCRGQPEAFSEKTGKPDIRGAYGLHGREMIGWLTHLQHTRGKHVWLPPQGSVLPSGSISEGIICSCSGTLRPSPGRRGRKALGGRRITPAGWERKTGLRLRFVYRRTGPSLLVAEGRLNTRGHAVASRAKTGRGLATAPIFLLVPEVRLPKRLDLARDAERAHDAVPGLIVANWMDGR